MAESFEIAAGLLLVLAAMYDLFQSVVLPRPTVTKVEPVRLVIRSLWIGWRWAAGHTHRQARREAQMAAFGPFAVFVMFGVWTLALIAGYALIFDGLGTGFRPAETSFGDALYTSATSFVPLSYGDVVPIGTAARVATVVETGTGIIVGALIITLLFSMYGSFQRREELVVTLDAMAGAPPSGVQILETAADHRIREHLTSTFDAWAGWAAAVLESHLAYPVLVYFRSSHDNEAWLNSFGAVMDASALIVSTVKDESEGAGRLMITIGDHLVDDFAGFFHLDRSGDPYVEREEFDEAVTRLRAAGYVCRGGDAPWEEFAGLRARYASPLNQMAKFLAIVPAPWIGDRSYLPHERSRASAGRNRRHPRSPSDLTGS